MKLFWIVPECPFPANTGGRVGIWKRIEYMSKDNDIYLFSIIDRDEEKLYKPEIERYCKAVSFYKRNRGIQSLLASTVNPYPAVSRWNRQMKEDLRKKYEEVQPDFVVVDLPQMYGVLPQNIICDGRIVLNQHNIEFLSMKSLARGVDSLIKRCIYKIVAIQMQQYEERIYRKNSVALYTFVSLSDKEYFEKKYGNNNTLLVPVGAEVNRQNELMTNNNHNIIFVGKLSYPPNEEGIIWFLDKVFPQVKKNVTDAKVYVVGKDPTDSVKKRKSNSVIVTGEVVSVEPYYKQCNVAVVPIMTGGGVNVKLLEALGYGKIVITTTKGIEGTNFLDGKHLLVGDSTDTFSAKTIEALTYSDEIRQIQKNAIEYMHQNYSWQGVVKGFEKALRNIKQ